MNMERRTFLSTLASVPLAAAPQLPTVTSLVRWTRDEATRLFTQARCGTTPLVVRGGWGLLTARVEPQGACQVSLAHRLLRSGRGGEDILEAELTIRNASNEARTIEATFATSAHPTEALGH